MPAIMEGVKENVSFQLTSEKTLPLSTPASFQEISS
jgi:hypothetical protein